MKVNKIKYNEDMYIRCLKRAQYFIGDSSEKKPVKKAKTAGTVEKEEQAVRDEIVSRACVKEKDEPYGIGVGQYIECQIISG